MRTSNNILAAAALAGLAAASPAPQQLDFNAIAAAPTLASGPSANGVVIQTATFISTVSVATTATASITGSATAAAATGTGLAKRSLQERNLYCNNNNIWCTWFGWGCCPVPSSTPAKTTSVSSAASKTSSSSSSIATSSAAAGTTGYTPYYPALASVTAYTTGTTTISSTSSCPTTPEDGTYCGFLNPLDPCGPQPDGYGPVPTPDTVSAFQAYAPFHSMASAAPTTISAASTAAVSGIVTVYNQTFKDLNAASSAQSYLGLFTLQTYDAAQCAAYCDSTALCTAFNIFIERDPSVAPSTPDNTAPTVWGNNCPNPASMTSYKCTLWGSNLDASSATNQGQWREQFQIVITGSNGYDKTNVTIPATPTGSNSNGSGWSKGSSCGGKAINAPQYWMGSKFFPGPFNAQVCGDYAFKQNSINKAQAVSMGRNFYTPCNMVNAYYLHKNGKPHGTYCALYDTDVALSWATYNGGFSGSDRFDCKQSYKFTLQNVDSGKC
ncbi:hypothetical protein AAFC00_006036 [Neodothiora populina]|uniref:Uncharacterized protein n=1 Tax=Neodothiora populina TaxID=2781224 RepID=A0ABR3P838_9PEZI